MTKLTLSHYWSLLAGYIRPQKARFALLLLLLSLALAFGSQARAGQESLHVTRQAVRLYLPLIARNYNYVEPVGVLDPTFDGDGVVFTVMGETIGSGLINDLLVQPDGKILVTGMVYESEAFDFGLARYHPDGSLDASFGEDGKVQTDFIEHEEARAIALQPDGKIVVAGLALGESTTIVDFALARYHPDGSLDTGFDGDGWVTTDFFGDVDYGYDVAVQPDGKILVAGSALASYENEDIALARYNPDGSLDTSFGSTGKVVTDSGDQWGDAAYAVVLQEDSKIVVAGFSYYYSGSDGFPIFILARYNPDGSLDMSFDEDGLVTTDVGMGNIFDLLLQPDGKIVAAGSVLRGLTQDFALVRYHPDGSLDTSFGQAGAVITDWGCNEYPYAIVLQPNGKIIAAGSVWCNQNSAYVLARYNPDGSLDPGFGYNGKLLTELGTEDYARALGLQADGKIVVGGSGFDGSAYVFTLLRYK